ncbi:MAG TPA: beta-ketoacyl reductase, partial [Verrucomicrobiae bacterium]|nr:beta-ketoacyl reductase [Verrucomicrobiae bacterium]
SSTTAWWGAAGLGHYAAANQALDLLAQSRRAKGLPALSVNFGTWADMRVASEADKRRFMEAGLHPMEPRRALAALERLILTNRPSAAVASVDWEALSAVYETRRPRPLFAEMRSGRKPEAVRTRSEPPASEQTEIARRLSEAPPARKREILIAHLRAEAGAVLGFDSSREIELDQGLFDMGMDSLMSVDLKGRLEKSLGVQLPSTLLFNYPSIGALAEHLLRDFVPSESSPKPAPSTPVVQPSNAPPTSPQAPSTELSEEELSQLILKKLERKR